MQTKLTHPLIDLHLFNNRNFNLYLFIRLGWQLVWFMMFFMVCIMLQNIFGYSAIKTGLVVLGFTVTFGLVSPFSGRLFDKVGPRWLILLGLLLSIASSVMFTFTQLHSQWFFFVLALILSGFALGLSFPNLMAACLKSVAPRYAGMAGGALYTCLYLGAALGTTLAGVVVKLTIDTQIMHHLSGILKHPTSLQLSAIRKVASGADSAVSLTHDFTGIILQKVTLFSQHIFIEAYVSIMKISIIIAILMIVAVLLTKNAKKA